MEVNRLRWDESPWIARVIRWWKLRSFIEGGFSEKGNAIIGQRLRFYIDRRCSSGGVGGVGGGCARGAFERSGGTISTTRPKCIFACVLCGCSWSRRSCASVSTTRAVTDVRYLRKANPWGLERSVRTWEFELISRRKSLKNRGKWNAWSRRSMHGSFNLCDPAWGADSLYLDAVFFSNCTPWSSYLQVCAPRMRRDWCEICSEDTTNSFDRYRIWRRRCTWDLALLLYSWSTW
jgi:hypothetical protein